MSEVEPRRSVRATKGQHTKSFDELETTNAPKRRQTKKSKKAQEQEQEQEHDTEPEEVIRCVCGASEQDDDSGEAWIMCDTCSVWQHNVCMGVSPYEDEIPDHYWCEQCRPHDHKDLLDAIAKGEKPWEARRTAHEEEEQRKKKKGGRKSKGKRTSDTKDEMEKDRARSRSKQPENGSSEVVNKGKRKSRDGSHDTETKSTKLRRVSDDGAHQSRPAYTAPSDLPTSLSDLSPLRAGPAKAMKKSILASIASLAKSGDTAIPDDTSAEAMAERYAIQIERAVYDTHPSTTGQKEYGQQIKSLNFNLKKNPELCQGLVDGTYTPNTLAVMTSDELASSEQQRQTAEMRARAEKQSILYTQEAGPRVRRTHKGEEFVEEEQGAQGEAPPPVLGGGRRQVKREPGSTEHGILPTRSPSQPEGGDQPSPSNPNFDISKVFSSVKSPTGNVQRRPSAPTGSHGPGVDADVDRMLEDENDSPPYSPTEEAVDPDVVWRGSLAMSSIADFQANAKHVGGANFASIGPWAKLIPKRMTVAGRIPQQSAIEYLCSLRYSNLTDIVVVSLTPASPTALPDFNRLIDYFVNKQRYGVVGDKVAGNVRDTYLVPVPPGDDNHPEFMLNLVDNTIPKSRTEPLLLAVFVYRNDPEAVKTSESAISPAGSSANIGTPTPAASGHRSSISGPSFSPATPHANSAVSGPPPAFNARVQSQTPVPIPQPPHARSAQPPAASPPASGSNPSPAPLQPQTSEAEKYQAQQRGQAEAKEVLGSLITVPTVQFLLPQAFQMTRREWEVIKDIYEREPKAKDDLQYLGQLLEKSSVDNKS